MLPLSCEYGQRRPPFQKPYVLSKAKPRFCSNMEQELSGCARANSATSSWQKVVSFLQNL